MVWRAACAALAVAQDVVVCEDGVGLRAIAVGDGSARWTRGGALVTVSGDHVVIDRDGALVVVAAATGALELEVDGAALPGVRARDVRASCGADGRELFAATRDGKLVRLAAAAAGPAKIVWSAPIGPLVDLDACAGDVVRATGVAGDARAIVALDRVTGKETGRVAGVRGAWRARAGDGRVEVASASGVASWAPELAGQPALLALPPLGELVAARGERRLVRVTAAAATLLDAHGARALLALGDRDAVLGDQAIVAASPGGRARRFAIPPPWARRLRGWRGAGLAVPAELRDLPARGALDAGISASGGAALDIADVAIDPDDPAALYALVATGAAGTTGLARVDLAARAWRWLHADACPRGAFAIAHAALICGGAGTVRALDKDGVPRWDWRGVARALVAAGDVVLAIDGARATALDARDGHVLGALVSDDGADVHAALLAIDGETWLVAAERGRVVARLPTAAMLPVWSRVVDGSVRAISASGDGALVELDDGDAYRVDAHTGEVVALPALGQRWAAYADTLVGQTAGGPIPPGDSRWLPPPPRAVPVPLHPAPPPRPEIESPPPFTTSPWPAPPATAASVQLTFCDPHGGVRTRNDYALGPASVVAAARGPADSPILLGDGLELVVLEPRHGDAVSRVAFPMSGAPFSTVVDGKPLAGAILGAPLRLVLF